MAAAIILGPIMLFWDRKRELAALAGLDGGGPADIWCPRHAELSRNKSSAASDHAAIATSGLPGSGRPTEPSFNAGR